MKDKPGGVYVAARRHGGTHLINPLIKGISGRKAISLDKSGRLFVPDGPLVVFTRDPRNIATARFRWKLRQQGLSDRPTFKYDAHIAERLMRVNRPSLNIPDELVGLPGLHGNLIYWRWWLNQIHHRVTFEELTEGKVGGALKRLGKYVGRVRDPETIFYSLYKQSHTYSGSFSDWRKWWGPKTKEAFYDNGGRELLKLLGYRE